MTVQYLGQFAAEALEEGAGEARLAGLAVEAMERPVGSHNLAGVALEMLADVGSRVPPRPAAAVRGGGNGVRGVVAVMRLAN